MALTPGTRLGVYEVTAQIGEGGMGQVYRAHDTRLNRDVALKILPDAFASDPDRLARFTREAQTLASLNHPHIAAIYGIEESNGIHALVMELVEGEDLAQRITSGAIPLDDALPIAKQIAEALEAAHEQGIIHRDLKPANIKVRPDGTVKVLDFGLAKAMEPVGSAPNVSHSPTITTPAMTQAGVILGTAAYMSPEQAKGRPADKRSDVWALGCVLYEMLTGARAFQGDDVSDTLAAVLRGEPNWTTLPAGTPPLIRRLLRRCLEKDRKRRLADAADARLEIEDGLAAPSAADEAAAQDRTSRQRSASNGLRHRMSQMLTGALLLTTLALGFLYFRQAPAERLLRYAVAAPENGTVHSFAVSPDGRYVTIAAGVNGKRQLWLRPLDALQVAPMPGTEDGAYPFWSPDSRYIGFFAQGKLKKIAAGGGPAQSLCDVPDGRGGSWNREDVIVFSPSAGSRSAIQRVPAAGGVPSDVTKTGGDYRFPVFLPDGRHFLYLATAASLENKGVYLSSLDGGENRRVLADASGVVFAPVASGSRAGHLLFIRDNTLMAQTFDAGSAQLSGDVFPIAEEASFSLSLLYAPVTVSENGVLVYATGGTLLSSQIAWFDRTGKLIGPVSAFGNVYAPAISPDEKMMAFTRNAADGTTDIWLRDLARNTDTRFTSDASQNFSPFWSPNADRLAFRSNRRGSPGDLYQKGASGSNEEELLLSTPNTKLVNQWSRDDDIVYTEIDPKTKEDLWVLPADRKPVKFLQTEFREFQGQISPDGHWMAYTSDHSRQREVYVRPFPASEGIWKISTAGGEQPRWRGDGRELFFVGADGKLTAVSVKGSVGAKPSFEVGASEPLFEAHIVATGTNAYQYDVTPDGKHFLVNTATPGVSAPLTVVVNWRAGLRK